MEQFIISARPRPYDVNPYIISIQNSSIFDYASIPIDVFGSSFFNIKNVYLSANDSSIFGIPTTYYNPFATIKNLSADNVGFNGILLENYIINSEKNITIYPTINFTKSGYFDIILENEAGLGVLTRDSFSKTPTFSSFHYQLTTVMVSSIGDVTLYNPVTTYSNDSNGTLSGMMDYWNFNTENIDYSFPDYINKNTSLLNQNISALAYPYYEGVFLPDNSTLETNTNISLSGDFTLEINIYLYYGSQSIVTFIPAIGNDNASVTWYYSNNTANVISTDPNHVFPSNSYHTGNTFNNSVQYLSLNKFVISRSQNLSSVNFYHNGSKVATLQDPLWAIDFTGKLLFGEFAPSNPNNTGIREITVFNRCLTDNEINSFGNINTLFNPVTSIVNVAYRGLGPVFNPQQINAKIIDLYPPIQKPCVKGVYVNHVT